MNIIDNINEVQTPFYLYDLQLLKQTLQVIVEETVHTPHFHVHYAVKANSNADILSFIFKHQLGADCVSGGEIAAALAAGVPAEKIVFAGVGKSDKEIEFALKAGIGCFNVESIPELEVISEWATQLNTTARIAFRVNPDVDAHTHAKITTGTNENKFGIAMEDLLPAIRRCNTLPHVEYTGLHFHIGSQILDLSVYENLCTRINELQNMLDEEGYTTKSINVGGGLGIDYAYPHNNPIPDFKSYFRIFRDKLQLRDNQDVHFELGRSIVGQCGSLISKVLYVKQGHSKQFVIVDAGFTDLIRPAMYDAYHSMRNLTRPQGAAQCYDVVGPICESSDVFAKDAYLPQTQRGDLIAFDSAGAYGEVMASRYNCRELPAAYFKGE